MLNRSNVPATRKSIRLRVLAVKPAQVGYFRIAFFITLLVATLFLQNCLTQSAVTQKVPRSHRRLPGKKSRKPTKFELDLRRFENISYPDIPEESQKTEDSKAYDDINWEEIQKSFRQYRLDKQSGGNLPTILEEPEQEKAATVHDKETRMLELVSEVMSQQKSKSDKWLKIYIKLAHYNDEHNSAHTAQTFVFSNNRDFKKGVKIKMSKAISDIGRVSKQALYTPILADGKGKTNSRADFDTIMKPWIKKKRFNKMYQGGLMLPDLTLKKNRQRLKHGVKLYDAFSEMRKMYKMKGGCGKASTKKKMLALGNKLSNHVEKYS